MKKIIFLLCTTAIATFGGSCTKFLDTVPDNRTEIDNIGKIKALLVSAYPETTYALILDPRCDGYADYGSTSGGIQPESPFDCMYTAFRWDEYSKSESGNDSNEQYWGACYGAIAAANHALEAMEKIGYKSEYAPYKGEALLCRAYGHFMLLSLFSNMFDQTNQAVNPGIPYITKPETVVIKQYDRETVAQTLEKIKADLDEGLRLAGSYADFEQPKFHFTRNSALAFAARFALFTGDYQGVINYVSQVIPQVSQHTKLSIKNTDGTTNEIPSASDPAAVFARNNFYDWNYARSAFSSIDAMGQAFSSPKNNNVLLSSEAVSIVYRGFLGTALSRYMLSPTESKALFKANATGLDWDISAINLINDNAFWVPKYYEDFRYTNITAGTGIIYSKFALFRMEEMLLARAEAFALTGQYAKAFDDLNIYTQRRLDGYNATKAALYKDKVIAYYKSAIDNSTSFVNNSFNADRFSGTATSPVGKLQRALVMTCLDFRRTEYAFEGMRWFDILRWNIPVTHTLLTGEASTLTPNDDRRVIQVPQTVALSGVESNRMTNIPFPW